MISAAPSTPSARFSDRISLPSTVFSFISCASSPGRCPTEAPYCATPHTATPRPLSTSFAVVSRMPAYAGLFRLVVITASSGARSLSLLPSHAATTAYLPLTAMFSTLRARISSSTLTTTSTLCD